MSATHALSNDQVAGELKKMTAFIRQEALEKAREIQIKADEEFAIEKSKLVREETAAIDATYEKRFEQAGMSQQITKSTVANKSRIRLLAVRQELLDDLFDEASMILSSFAKDKAKYAKLLENLILESLYLMNKSKVQIRVKKSELDLIKTVIPAVEKEFQSKDDKEVKIELDSNSFLPDELAGGVIVTGTGGKIEINNTLNERLRILETEALPSIRCTLFGENQNRRFHD